MKITRYLASSHSNCTPFPFPYDKNHRVFTMAGKRKLKSGSSAAKRRRSSRQAAGHNLESLPSELIVQILEYLDPDDFSAAYITSRSMYNIATPLLVTHKSYRKQYTLLDRSNAHSTPTLLHLLEVFMLNPRARLFPKTLRVGRLHRIWGNSTQFSPNANTILQKALDRYAPRGQGGLAHPAWVQRFWAGHEEMCLLILLCLLPNLEVLEMLEIPERWLMIFER